MSKRRDGYYTGENPSPYKATLPEFEKMWITQFDAEYERGRANAKSSVRLHKGCGKLPCSRPKCTQEHPDGVCNHKNVCKGNCLLMERQNAWEALRRGPKHWEGQSTFCTHDREQDVFDCVGPSTLLKMKGLIETAAANEEDRLIEVIDLQRATEDGKNVKPLPKRRKLKKASNF